MEINWLWIVLAALVVGALIFAIRRGRRSSADPLADNPLKGTTRARDS